MNLSPDEISTHKAWASQVSACTCKTRFNDDTERYVVDRHTCDYCREWDRKLTELGVSSNPRPADNKKPGKRKYRSAA